MFFRKKEPKIIENVIYSNYTREIKKRSAIGLREQVVTDVVLCCPRCLCPQPGMLQGEQRQCPSCGLFMMRLGNGLSCSESKMTSEEVLKA